MRATHAIETSNNADKRSDIGVLRYSHQITDFHLEPQTRAPKENVRIQTSETKSYGSGAVGSR